MKTATPVSRKPSSAPRPRTWPGNLANALAALGLSASAGLAAEAYDVVPALPRTADEMARIGAVTAPATTFGAPERYEANPGGAGTVDAPDARRAFLHPPANIGREDEIKFVAGQAIFEKIWVAAPTVTRASDGLGPLYNARACISCHVNNGRGHPPENPGKPLVSLVLHIGQPADPQAAMASVEGWLDTLPDPKYGRQLQPFAAVGHAAEAAPGVIWEAQIEVLGDGTEVSLRRPVWQLDGLAHGPLAEATAISPRTAPQMIGLGLLEAIPAAEILAIADPDDADGDGISGRANFGPGPDGPTLGRFGWKAASTSVRQQSATAFSRDIGISTPLFPEGWGDCTPAQDACRAGPHGDGDARVFEADAAALDATAFYAANLAVPARRGLDDPRVLAGKRLFSTAGCTSCHRPKHVTARIPDDPARSFQLIWPYTDLLIHDMGAGLADGFSEGLAGGQEFRTAPLWGIGLTNAVNGATTYLHDGRARSLSEAVLWHGGEAQGARDAFAAMTADDRAALVAFLESL